jgi:VIT1/CCC1 family predicted Fe2+/Mn2+ transporter
MESIPRNVILDLLPIYIAGEASEESKALVEEFAQNDSQIANLISTEILETDPISQKTVLPDDLEMKTIKQIRHSIRLKVWYVAFATAAILVAPLVAMQFTDEVNWGLLDFIVMGFLLFGTGITYVLISRISERIAYRMAVGIAAVAGFLLIWMNLAIGIIGSEDNPINLIYLGVLAIIIIGAVISKLQPLEMSRTMFATAIAQMLVPVIVLIFWRSYLEESPGMAGVFALNAFFAALFVISAFLFRSAARR